MKKIFIFSALASVIFISCQKETSLATAPSTKPSGVALKSSQSTDPNNATVFTFDLASAAYPIDPIDNLCTGVPLTFLSGTGQVAAHLDSKPWNFTLTFKDIVVQGADGTIYRGSGTNTYQYPQDYNGTVPVELNNTAHFNLTTAGGGNNISLGWVFKGTINANGVFTVLFTKTTVTCR